MLDMMQKQDKLTKGVLGGLSASTLDFAAKINSANNINGLATINQIANSYRQSSLTDAIIKGSQGFNNPYLNKLSSFDKIANSVAIKGLSSSLLEIANRNQSLSEKLLKGFNAQIALSNKLVDFASKINTPAFQNYNALNVAIAGFSNNYLNTIIKQRDWDNLEDFSDVSERIETITDEYASSTTVTVEYLEAYKESIITELSSVFEKSKSEKIRQFIIELLTLVSFILAFYSAKVQHDDLSNREVVEYTKKEIDSFKKEISLEIKKEFERLNKTRIARTDVILRNSDKKNSKRLGVVKKGQEVFVLEIRHKWILISYIDDKTKEPKSGYAYKKYFPR